jgi:hypothetical protein
MSEPRRMAAIRRLFLTKLEKQPSDAPHELRVERARKELDKALGPIWREEVRKAGVELDPTGDMIEKDDMQERLDNLPMATRDEGYQGLDVEEPVERKKKPEEKDSMFVRLVKIFG